ncbi:TonB-dependent receptor [Terrimonas pollutisoli]|uniref:TonB-dependent receptor n=1 Tax=Terrimonas pollutisoli TaxID=3034147 RepID=UPI0023EC4687|nr:carboxypeptidase regulatory-like domain-containing protein [Terrimonas sp. H1YJ31]
MRFTTLVTLLSLLFPFFLTAQQSTVFTQSIRGTALDNTLQTPVAGATVILQGAGKSVITDQNGNFRFSGVSLTSQQLHILHTGYKDAAVENIVVNAGKETVLTILLETNVRDEKEVTVKATTRKNQPLNEMSAVSARAFTVEETQKYAAAVNDPLRMAVGFPGVMAADDGNNSIVIRGNSPAGLLWRMEGVDIPNPNHFSGAATSGGGISILSSQLLANSDFVTGAFAAEYGNALSGVFDLKLRKGNNEKKEYSFQAGVLGLNAAAEGPIATFYKGSYLVNYRYSTLSLLNKLGVLNDGSTTNFQDLSYNIYLPAGKLGDFTVFGFGGLSNDKFDAKKDSSTWKESGDRDISKFVSNTAMSGLTHTILLGNKTNLRSAIGLSYNTISYNEKYIEDDYSESEEYRGKYDTRKWTLSSTLNHRFNTRHILRGGVMVNFIQFAYNQHSKENRNASLEEMIDTRGNTELLQSFAQWQYKPSNDVAVNAGFHYIQLLYNKTTSLEPRASVKWDISKKSNLSFGYGLHSQVQPLGVYFAQIEDGVGNMSHPNKNLRLTRAHHFVVSHQYRLAKNLRLKTEVYYQHLFKVPISISDTSSFSVLNVEGDYVTDPLVNKGKGKNYGVEISLEKYLANNFYYTLSNSLYQSKYTAADGKERNTRFNGNYIVSFLAGKEFLSANKLRTIGVNIKTIYAGGYRTTPIDKERSVQEGYTIFREEEAYSLQNPAYFRTDLRLGIKWNRRKITSTLSLDIQNLTNRLNIYNQTFDEEKGSIVTNYQAGLIPILNYKIEF